jgi:hypothetical protein
MTRHEDRFELLAEGAERLGSLERRLEGRPDGLSLYGGSRPTNVAVRRSSDCEIRYFFVCRV